MVVAVVVVVVGQLSCSPARCLARAELVVLAFVLILLEVGMVAGMVRLFEVVVPLMKNPSSMQFVLVLLLR